MGRFPLMAFARVDPDEIRRHLPEFQLYVDSNPASAGELTRKESGYIAEIMTLAALEGTFGSKKFIVICTFIKERLLTFSNSPLYAKLAKM